jgi:hypothetical protein
LFGPARAGERRARPKQSADEAFQRRPRRLDPVLELGRVEPAHRMLDDDEPRLDLPRLGLSQDQRPEGVGRDDVGGNAAFSEFDAVVETPR